MPVRRRPATRRRDHEHHGEGTARLFTAQQHRHLVAEGAENLGIRGQGQGIGKNRRHAAN